MTYKNIQHSNDILDPMPLETPQETQQFLYPRNQHALKRSADGRLQSDVPPSKRQTKESFTFLTLAFKDWTDNDFLHKIHLFKINRYTKLEELFRYYANGRNINDITSYNFYYKGKILDWSDTILSCGIKDYDVIDCVRFNTFQ